MLNIHNLTVSFQGEDLFKEITFRLGTGDRTGLIGKNGAGKSTMLKIISGDQEYDSGQIALAKEVEIGFLRQDIDFIPGRSVLEESYQGFATIKKLEFQIAELNEELSQKSPRELNVVSCKARDGANNALSGSTNGVVTAEKIVILCEVHFSKILNSLEPTLVL